VKLLFDENLSPRLARLLDDLFPGSSHVHSVGMGVAPDGGIWDYARDNGFVIVTKDVDFYHRALRLGHPPKIVWLRLGNCSTG
jgi:predicted nuclease of predicted toxin-antitoxin system